MSQDHPGTTVSNELVKSNAECFEMVKEILENKDRLTSPALVMRDSVARPHLLVKLTALRRMTSALTSGST